MTSEVEEATRACVWRTIVELDLPGVIDHDVNVREACEETRDECEHSRTNLEFHRRAERARAFPHRERARVIEDGIGVGSHAAR